jgi:ribonuclease BN (tRNA processing enzyme)
VEVAKRARVRQLVLFHLDPDRDDEAVDRIVNAAREQFPNTAGAREGWTITF